jgi:hypothetical protein
MRRHQKSTILLVGAALALTACGGATAAPPAPTTTPTTAFTANAAAITKAWAYYVSSVHTQNLGTPATLNEATPLIQASCQLFRTSTPAVAFQTLAQTAQQGANVTLNTGVQDILLATSAAKFVCPTYWAAVTKYLASVGS